MPNHSSISSDPLKNVKMSIHLKPMNNNYNKERNLRKILKLEGLLLMRFCHIVWSISWVLSMKVMKISQRKMGMNKKIKMKNNKHLKPKNQNLREKTTKHQQ